MKNQLLYLVLEVLENLGLNIAIILKPFKHIAMFLLLFINALIEVYKLN